MSNLIVEEPEFAEIRYVLENLSAKSQEDIFGALEAQPVEVAKFMFSRRDAYRWAFYHDGKPAALLGAYRTHYDTWSLFGMGTSDWKRVWRLVTLVAKRDMMQAVLDAGACRAQCISPASHADTHKWLRYLGASHEVDLPRYGQNGEDYIMFSWIRE